MFKLRKKPIGSLFPNRSLDELIKRSRILVIDDDDSAFPIDLMRLEGYNVDYWEKVTSLKSLTENFFDIIVLDLNGVASKEITDNDGIGVLKFIKSTNPGQIVVAYSAKKYDLTQREFWKLSDDLLGKPSPLDKCKDVIDKLLEKKFNADYYWNTLQAYLRDNEVPNSEINKIEKYIRKSLNKTGSTGIDINSLLSGVSISKDVTGIASNLLRILDSFAQ